MDEIKKSEWYQEVSLEDAKLYIRSNLLSEARSFIASGYYLKRIRDRELYLEDGYKNISEFAYGEYGLSASATSRRMSINDRFSQNGNSPNIKDEFKDFRKSQLQEMLGLSDEQLEKITPDTQVMQIREIKRGESIAPYTGPQLDGQIDISDFPEYMPGETLLSDLEHIDIQHEKPGTVSMEISVEDMIGDAPKEPEGDSVAISQKEPLSADGTPKTIRPEGSLLSTPGCEGGHDCFNCHVECGIRQKYCYCVEAPMGNPFPCVTLELIENLKGEMGERCQFVDNSLANHRTVVKEPVPCCKNCADPCKYACERAGKCKEVAISQKEQEPEQEISSESDTCPPNNSSCRRQEWGTDPEAQKRGREDCKKCWQDAKKLQTVVEKVEEPREPEPMEEAEEEAVYCFTAGRCGANDGAYGVTWATIVKAYLDKLHDNGTAPISGDIPAITVEAMGHECLVEPGYDAEFWKDDRLWFKVEWQRLQNEYEWFYPEKPVEEPQEPLAKEPEPEVPVVIDAEYTEVPEPPEEEYTLDFFLKEQNQKLEEFLKVEGVPCIVLERQKYIVAALAAMKADMEIEEFKRTYKPEQPELPILKNNDQRGAFVDAYETWPLWVETKETGERYYKYDLPDGTSMVVKVYHSMLFDGWADNSYESKYREAYGRHEYYLLHEGKFFKDCDVNRSYLIDKLKEIQRKDK